jgi:hypothetical protein
MRILDLLQGLGLSAASGIRPFLPALVAGAFASADTFVDFDGTDLAFLESTGWLLAIVVATVLAVLVQRRIGADRMEAGPLGAALGGLALGIGALLCAGSLADHAETWWPGLLAGFAAALLAQVAVRDLLHRTRARLQGQDREALSVYADGTALILAALSVLVPPVSVLALAFFAWLLVGGRRREGEKYAGLRILK